MNTLTKKILAIPAALLVCGFIAPASPQAGTDNKLAMAKANFPWEGEELFYKVKVNGSEAAHAVIRLGKVRSSKGKPYIALSGKAKSIGLFHTIYPMDDRANTFIDPFTYQPLRSEKVFKEAGKGRTYEVDYSPLTYSANVHKTIHKDAKNPEDRKRRYTKALPNTTHDALTWFLELRDEDAFTTGQTLSYYIYDGWKLSRVDLEAMGEERVLTSMGWFTTMRFDIQREIVGTKRNLVDKKPAEPTLSVIQQGKPTGSLWISTDKRRLPVKLQMTSKYGTGVVELARYVAPKKKRARPQKKKTPAK